MGGGGLDPLHMRMQRPTLLPRWSWYVQVEPGHGVFYFDLLQAKTACAVNPPVTLASLEECELGRSLRRKVRQPRGCWRALGCMVCTACTTCASLGMVTRGMRACMLEWKLALHACLLVELRVTAL